MLAHGAITSDTAVPDTSTTTIRPAARSRRKQAHGYGLALLLIFIASTVLVGTSLSMTLMPSVTSTLGIQNMDLSATRQVALVGLAAAEKDIKSKLATNTAVTTSYRYPASGSTDVVMPTSPDGSTRTVGSYVVTVAKTRGITYLLKSIATVNNMAYTQYKLTQIAATPTLPAPLAAYSLRKFVETYAGKAVNVRCATTGTTADIGFTANGQFDIPGLRSCLGDSTLPLNVQAAAAAYSLRKLSTSYAGKAIQVRRSSDGQTQDIGFDSNGNLDTKALMSFVGTNSGYVKIWYDQSGNSKNVSQSTDSQQPRIVNAGVLEMTNNAPTIRFINSASTTLTTTNVPLASGCSTYTYFAVLRAINPNGNYTIVEQNTSSATASRRGALSTIPGNWYRFTGETNDATSYAIPVDTLFQTTMTVDNSQTNNVVLYKNGDAGSASSTPNRAALNLGANGFAIASKYSQSNEYLDGYISEIIVYNSVVGTTNRKSIQNSEGHYFNVAAMQDGFVTTWYDQSGNTRNATQSTVASQPVIVQTGAISPNGTIQPSVQFDGSGDSLYTAATTVWPAGDADRTLNVVYKLNNLSGGFYIPFGWGSLAIGYNGASYIVVDYTYGFYACGAGTLYTASMTSDNYVHEATMIKGGSTISGYRDGAFKGSTTSGTLATSTNEKLAIGTDVGWHDMPGNVAEAVLYDKGLNSGEANLLKTSQSNYYGQ